ARNWRRRMSGITERVSETEPALDSFLGPRQRVFPLQFGVLGDLFLGRELHALENGHFGRFAVLLGFGRIGAAGPRATFAAAADRSNKQGAHRSARQPAAARMEAAH